jgi:hypothetical protein
MKNNLKFWTGVCRTKAKCYPVGAVFNQETCEYEIPTCNADKVKKSCVARQIFNASSCSCKFNQNIYNLFRNFNSKF